LPVSDFLGLPARTGGLTHVLDKGLGTRAVEDFLETTGDYVDIVKLGWGTAYVTRNLERKLELYRAAGKPTVVGGTFFEAVLARDQIDAYKSWLSEHRFTHVEISDGTFEIARDRKLELISELARDFTVLSEVGSKDSSLEFEADRWTTWLKEELDAGAWKVITEAREGGTAGIFTKGGELRTGIVDEIAQELEVADVIFEAPTRAAQVWFIKEFGPEVNLGNIAPDEVIPLETLRLGLRADTFKEVLLGGERAPAS
jgi:phosphosulfolactate synthase